MAKKSSKKSSYGGGRGRGRQQEEPRRKVVTYTYKRNYTMGIGILLFTFAWVLVVSPMLAGSGSNRILGYVLLIVVSAVNWYIGMYSLRLVPWSPVQIILGKSTVTVRTAGGKDRTVMRNVKRLRMQKNPLFFFSRGLMIFGETSEGRAVRESVFFGDLGAEQVYKLADDLKRYT